MEQNEHSEQLLIVVEDNSGNAQAIFAAQRLAGRAGFAETERCLIATAVSELGTNILKYAGEGVVQLRIVRKEDRIGLEVLAEDAGPGITNVVEALQDNVSTGNSLGLGLPSVRRIMDEFAIESTPGRGTRVVATKWR